MTIGSTTVPRLTKVVGNEFVDITIGGLWTSSCIWMMTILNPPKEDGVEHSTFETYTMLIGILVLYYVASLPLGFIKSKILLQEGRELKNNTLAAPGVFLLQFFVFWFFLALSPLILLNYIWRQLS